MTVIQLSGCTPVIYIYVGSPIIRACFKADTEIHYAKWLSDLAYYTPFIYVVNASGKKQR